MPSAGGRTPHVGRTTRVPALDGLRGVAASIVVIHHLVLSTVPSIANSYRGRGGTGVADVLSPLSVLWSGPAFVIVFFVLSGLVLALPASRGKRFNPAAYYPARMIRLYVPVWGALILAAVLHEVYARHASAEATWWINAHATGIVLGPAAHDASLVFGTGGFGLTSVLWSLRWEVIFSLLLPLFIWLARTSRRWHLPLAAISFAVIIGSGSHQVAHYLPTFLLGTLIAFNLETIREWPRKLAARPALYRVIKSGLVIGALGLLGCSRWVHATSTTGQGLVAALVAAGAVLAVLCPLLHPGVARALETRPAQWLGARSFSLYLVHEPVIVTLAFVLGFPALGILALPAVIASLLVAEVFYRAVERPSHRLARALGEWVPRQLPRLAWLPAGGE
jgi:peptidoglycan/LPS O-acetylase OafA/YrhL